MKTKRTVVPFLMQSNAGDWMCADGELAGYCGIETNTNGVLEDGVTTPVGSRVKDRIQLPPFVIEFRLKQGVLGGWHNHPANMPRKTVEPPKEKTQSGWGARALETVLRFQEDASEQNMFVNPFFAMAALRDDRGNRLLPTYPVLLVPNSEVPVVTGLREYDVETMEMGVLAKVCRLQMRIRMPEVPDEVKGKVTHLDIFVSDPMQKVTKDSAVIGGHREEIKLFSHSCSPAGISGEHRVAMQAFDQIWKFSPCGSVSHTRLREMQMFRHICEIPLDEIPIGDDFSDLEFNTGGIRHLDKLEEYRPDYAQLWETEASSSELVSGRLTLCGLKLRMPCVPDPSTLSGCVEGVVAEGRTGCGVEVKTQKNGKVLMAAVYDRKWRGVEIDGDTLPRWLFYPDPDVRSMTLITPGGSFVFPFRPHPRLHGSYFLWKDLRELTPAFSGIKETGMRLDASEDMDSRDSYYDASAIWRSGKDDFLFFPDSLKMRFDVGRVIAICRAFRSSGLVATTSPTVYAFTDCGVFLLKEMDDGSLKDAGLIGNYVLRDCESIWYFGDGLVFVSDAGETLVVEGTKIKRVTESSSYNSGKVVISGEGDFELCTRPLKLGDSMNLKRILCISMLGKEIGMDTEIAVYGSNDMEKWDRLATIVGTSIHGLWSKQMRVFKIGVRGNLSKNGCIEGLMIIYK